MHLDAATARPVGVDLSRPECVLVEWDGTIWASDNRATACRINPDGTQELYGESGGTPNGLAMDQEGMLFVADIEMGLVLRMDRNGREQLVLDEIDGHALGAANFPYMDEAGNLWVTVSTRTTPRSAAKSSPLADGYILRIGKSGPEVMTDGLFFTNEIRIDPGGSYLYTAETTAGRISRQALLPDGSLGHREPFGKDPLFPDALVDGIAFDEDGNLWVTELTRNAIFVLDPRIPRNAIFVLDPLGREHIAFEDPAGDVLREPSSVAFGGQDLRTLYVGNGPPRGLRRPSGRTSTCSFPRNESLSTGRTAQRGGRPLTSNPCSCNAAGPLRTPS